MPKREGPEDGGLLRPPGSSSRSRPTSAGNQRGGPYSGNAAFASSSSSVNSILRPADASTAAIIQNPSAVAAPSYVGGGGGPVDATEAPFLTSLEAHFGRMTLTAPDNMLRRKQEEKEKRQKARKRKAERAEAAILALSGVADTAGQRSVTPTQISNTAIPNTVYTTEILGTARRRPGLTASRSSSNLQTITNTNANETVRSRSPTRPPRPHSAQNATRSDTSPERRPSATINAGIASSSNGATRPTASQQETRRVRKKQRPQRQVQGAPSGEEHTVHTQNVSSPRRNQGTATGGAARSAVRAEALRRATQRRRDIYADLSTMGLPGASDSEPEEGPPPFPAYATRPISPPQPPADGQEWTEEMRRRQEEYITNKPPDSPPPAFRSEDEDVGTSNARSSANQAVDERSISADEESDNQVDESISKERRLWEEDVAAGFTFEERLERERQRRSVAEKDTSTPQPLPNLSLGQAVMAARARRNVPEERTNVPAEIANAEPETSIQQTLRKTAHRRTASEGKDQVNQIQVEERHTSRNAAVGTGRGLAEQNEREVLSHHGKVTKIRPRPASESHSRFRDDASAAANRRLALWASAKAQASGVPVQSVVASPSLLRSDSENHTSTPELQSIMSEISEQEANNLSRLRPQRKQTSSSSGGMDGGPESSDSEAEWAKEEKQFKRMQRKAAQNTQAIVDSSDEEDAGSDGEASMPGALHGERKKRTPVELPELGKVGSSVPRAPPPLVLGRSRGGAAFDSSSESSSESDVNRLEDEDSNSDSPPEMEDGPSAPHRVEENVQTTIDKGKQPVRPLPNLPSSESVVHYSTSEGDINSIRAGMFEEDSASSRDFTDDEEENDDFQNASSTLHVNSADRPAVQNRLKDLFAARLSPTESGEPSTSQNASRASLERLFDVPIDGRAAHPNANARRPSASERLPQNTRQASAETNSRSLWGNEASSMRNGQTVGSARTTSRTESMNEQEARREALNSLSQLQRNQDSLPVGVDRDSLAALERLLARTTPSNVRTSTSNASEPLTAEPSKLMRSGAIGNRQMASSSFSNPRSINAPRPLGRLPTITDATRHFPPSQAKKMEEETSSRLQNRSRRPPSILGTPSWMAYIPQQERSKLPDPMQPDVRLHDFEETDQLPPPPRNPSPTRGSRIQAMVQRFEQNADSDRDSNGRRPSSPTKFQPDLQRHSSQSSITRFNTENPQMREEQLRRRPPPPPPSLFGPRRKESTSRVASNEEQQPSVQASHNSSQASMARALHNIAIERQRQLSSSSSSAGSSAFNSPLLPHRPAFLQNPGAAQASQQVPSRFSGYPERQRSRPLPIPPTILPEERTGTSSPHATNHALPRRESDQLNHQIDIASIEPNDRHMETPELPTESAQEEVQNESPVNAVEETENTSTSIPSDGANRQSGQRRVASLGITDLDIFASRLADERLRSSSRQGGDGEEENEQDDEEEQGRDTYDDLHLLAEFLGPAKAPGLTQDEMERLPVGKVEILRRRIVGKRQDGRDKVKLALAVAGVKVERCAVCLVQFKEGNLACVFPCLHVLHEQCAAKLLRNTKQCPTCRSDVV